MFKVLIEQAAGQHDSLQDCFSYLNWCLYHHYPKGVFASGIYALFDVSKNTMTYVNASQEPIILLRRNQEPDVLRECDPALGLLEPDSLHEIDFNEHTVDLQAGDVVFFYTDGLVDFYNDMQEAAEQRQRLIEWLKSDMELSPQELVDDVYQRSLAYADLTEPPDDAAALAVRLSDNSRKG